MERRRRTARLAAAVSVLCLLLGCALVATAAPAAGASGKGGAGAAPHPDAAAWIVIDARDGHVITGHDVNETLPIASTTKLMTAYVTLHSLPLSKIVRAPGYDATPGESVLGLDAGERLSVRDLMTAMMLPSANDAAYALAEDVSGSVPRFVARMNAAAKKLGLDDTSYSTPDRARRSRQRLERARSRLAGADADA